MSGRTVLADALTAALPGWLVVSDARQLDTIPKPGACVLWTATRKRPDLAQLSFLTDEITAWILTATDKPSLIEDDLDDLLDAFLAVLEPLGWCVWTEATRGVLADKHDGWRIAVTCNYLITAEGT